MINKKPAFTLVEVLISVLIMTIIIGAVSMTAKIAIDLFEGSSKRPCHKWTALYGRFL